MKITKNFRISFHSHIKFMGLKRCLKSKFSIDKRWSGKITNIGNALFYISVDMRQPDKFVETMITGKVNY